MEKKNLIRITALCVGAFLFVSGIAVYQYSQAKIYRNYLSATYQRSFYNLIDYMSTVESSLEKSIHSSSSDTFATLSNKICSGTQNARNAIGELPLSSVQLEKMSNFITQLGQYTVTLCDKEKLSAEDKKNLDDLLKRSKSLTNSLRTMEKGINDGQISIWQLKSIKNSDQEPFAATFANMETQFDDYPSLVYDGPYSDHINQKKSVFLEGKKEISLADAKDIASKLLNVSPSKLSEVNGITDKIESYSFQSTGANGGVSTIDITKKGGYPLYFVNSKTIGNKTLSYDNAVSKAKTFLDRLGFQNMQKSYQVEKNGMLVINFVYKLGEYICYTDQVEIGVALDDGTIVFYNGSSYIMNHNKNRKIDNSTIKREDAQASLNDRLSVTDYSLAIIPDKGENEVAVHSFTCQNENNEKYMVFINTADGSEEDMLKIIEDEKGAITQ